MLIPTILTDKKNFFCGLLCGLLVAFFLFVLLICFFSFHGVTLELDGEEVAERIGKEVEIQAKKQLPQFIEQAKQTLPKEMAAQATAEFAKTNIAFLGVHFTLPSSALNGIEKQLEKTFQASLQATFQKTNPIILSKEIGKFAYQLSKTSLQKQVDEQTIRVKANSWLTIPVKIKINEK